MERALSDCVIDRSIYTFPLLYSASNPLNAPDVLNDLVTAQDLGLFPAPGEVQQLAPIAALPPQSLLMGSAKSGCSLLIDKVLAINGGNVIVFTPSEVQTLLDWFDQYNLVTADYKDRSLVIVFDMIAANNLLNSYYTVNATATVSRSPTFSTGQNAVYPVSNSISELAGITCSAVGVGIATISLQVRAFWGVYQRV